ncbi:MAG: peptidylprolyl isomerase [Xanthomonadales bacterium]|nr:peptidylprolyl isomerase [Xanthomonadales bacterium]
MEQGDSFVPISDMDAYVYLLPPEKRYGFITDKNQMEKNLITMLNINIVNDFITENDLENHVIFSNIEEVVNDMTNDLDEEFYQKLGLDEKTAYQNVKNFIVKKEKFIRMSELLKDQLLHDGIDTYLNEYFILHKAEYIKPEKRDISLIKINSEQNDASLVKNILNDLLMHDDKSYFSEVALKFSNDESVQLNQGHLKEFQKGGFSYPFAEPVFAYESIGVIPKIFKYDGNYYIVRINNIINQVAPEFADVKEKLTEKLLPEIIQERVQRVIDSKAKFKLEVNHEVATHVFERYQVLFED